jgi:hypothetical protein
MLSQFIHLYSTRVMNWKDFEGNGCGIIEVLPRKSSGRTEKNRKNLKPSKIQTQHILEYESWTSLLH